MATTVSNSALPSPATPLPNQPPNAPEATPVNAPFLDRLVDHALHYYKDFVLPTKRFRAPTETERAAATDHEATGRPARGRNCLWPPKRLPDPPATTTAHTGPDRLREAPR